MITTLKRWLHGNAARAEIQAPGCLCCGSCCEAFGGHLNATRADVARWRRQGRVDLLSRVNRLGWIWVDPDTKQPEARCPFLDKSGSETALCRINDTKPAMCRDYPTMAHERRCLRGVFLKF